MAASRERLATVGCRSREAERGGAIRGGATRGGSGAGGAGGSSRGSWRSYRPEMAMRIWSVSELLSWLSYE